MSTSFRLHNLLVLASACLSFPSRPRRRAIGPIARDAALAGMRDGLIVVDEAGLIVERNLAATALAGLRADAVGHALALVIRDRELAGVLEAMLREPGTTCARTVSCLGDEPRCLEITRTLMADARGRRLGALFMLRDVTAQARAELAQLRQAADLAALHRIAAVAGATSDVRDLLRAIVGATRPALGLAHASVGLIDERRGCLTITAESDDADGASALGTCVSLRGPFEEHWRSCAPIAIEDVRADARLAALSELLGRRNTRALLVVPLLANGRPIGTLNLASAQPYRFDRGELELAQTIAGYVAAAVVNARLFEASRQAARAKSAIFDTISHEFRTPITVILGFSELFQSHALGTATNEQSEALAAIHRNGLRLLKLVDDMLDLARLQAGEIELAIRPIEVGPCIEAAAAILADRLRQKQMALHLEIARELPAAYADAAWLRRVLVNLLAYAIHFGSAGAIAARAYAPDRRAMEDERTGASSVEHPLPAVVIEVEGNGPAISEQEQQAIFDAFQHPEDVEPAVLAASRLGLGLAVSRRVVEQMAGQLAVRSQPGQGTTFTIELPAAERALEHSQG